MQMVCDTVLAWLAALPNRKGKTPPGPDTDLIETGVLDSLAILDLVAFVETRYDLALPVEEFTPENFRNVRAIAALVQRLGERSVA